MKRNISLLLFIYLALPVVATAFPQQHHGLAFAGGGFGAKSSSSKKTTGKRQKRGGLISELPQPIKPEAEELDKWGFPPATEEDLFPPMPPGTELISAPTTDSSTAKVSWSSLIQDALNDHIKLDLNRFDDHGVERDPLPDREPMKLHLLHTSPPVLEIENFLTEGECQEVKDVTSTDPTTNSSDDNNRETVQVDSLTFSALATSKRTSTSWFCHYAQIPTLLAKARHILGIALPQMEEPQIVRYRQGEEFSWHYDEIPRSQLENGGQRVATLLVYLNNVEEGGGTIFRDLKGTDGVSQLRVKPRMGSALLFFPAFADGRADDRTLHKGEVAFDTKWICQMWIHQNNYTPVTPPGNSHDAALPAIQRVSHALRYTTVGDNS